MNTRKRHIASSDFKHDSGLDQLMHAEKELLIEALDQHLSKQHERLAAFIDQLMRDNVRREQPVETIHQRGHEIKHDTLQVTSPASSTMPTLEETEDFPEVCEERSNGSLIPSTHVELPVSKSEKERVKPKASKAVKHVQSRSLAGIFQTNDDGKQEPSGHQAKLRRCVESQYFDVFSTIMIVACVAVMAFEIQYVGMQTGYVLEVGSSEPAAQMWPHAETVILILDHVFNFGFSLELLMRLVALKLDAFRSFWVLLDSILVGLTWLTTFTGVAIGFDPMIFRLVRLLRLARVLRLLQSAQVVQTLFLLIRSIQASFGCLVWSFSILWFFQLIMAIVMSQLLQPFLIDESKNIEVRRSVFKYFGTFLRGTFTMFEITLGNWAPACRLLSENVSEWYGVFYLLYRCCFMFAVIKVITAVFIAETTRCANNDDELALHKKRRQSEQFCGKLLDVFQHLDSNGDGILSWKEFEPLVSHDMLNTWLTTLDIDTEDLEALYKIFVRHDGRFDMYRFIESMSRVRGPAKSVDVLKVQTSIDALNHKLNKILSHPSQVQGYAGTQTSSLAL